MTDDELDVIEAKVKLFVIPHQQQPPLKDWFFRVGPNDVLALVAEVRRLRGLQCVRMVSGEEPLYCHEHGWVP